MDPKGALFSKVTSVGYGPISITTLYRFRYDKRSDFAAKGACLFPEALIYHRKLSDLT